MSTPDSDQRGAGSKLHSDAEAELKARLHNVNVVDFDPLSYTLEDSFRKHYELREIQIAFEEYLLQTKSIKLISHARENWGFALKVKFPLSAPAYAGLLSDATVSFLTARSNDLSQQMIQGGYLDPVTGLMGNHPQMANTAAQRQFVSEEISSILS